MTATKIAELEARLEQAADGSELHREVVRHLVAQIAELTRERDRALACEAAALGLVREEYARGYRDGVEAAAKVADKYAAPPDDDSDYQRGWRRSAECAAKAIRSLPPPPASDALAQEAQGCTGCADCDPSRYSRVP